MKGLSSKDQELVHHARNVAVRAHRDQRYGNLPYTAHLSDVYNTLIAFGFTENAHLLAAAWLHDALEDTDLEPSDIRERFGVEVHGLVTAVTTQSGSSRRERFSKTYPVIAKDPAAICLKVADRISNVTSCWETRDARLFMYQEEYKDFRKSLFRPVKDHRIKFMWAHLDKLMGWK